jgi:hypothetical protein
MSVEDAKRQAALVAEARRRGLQPWELEMSKCVDDKLMRDIVNDFRQGPSKPSSLAGPGPEPKKGTGWQDEIPLKPPPGIGLVDQLCDAQDRKDKAELVRAINKSKEK